MSPDRFRGSTVALITPFQNDGSIDRKRLRELAEWHIEEGTDVILVNGTTGESATLSPAEQVEVAEIVVDQAAGRRPVLGGAGSNSSRVAAELAQAAEKAGVDGILSVAPYYNKPTQEGLFRHFQHVAAATSLPVILYNVPGRTASNLSAETTLRLAEIDNIVGVKEASGNLSQVMEILRLRPDGFLVLSGDDAWALPLIALGADGVVSVVANQTPGAFRELVGAALEGDWNKAREIHYRLLELMELNFVESNPIPVKTALAMMGRIEEVFRLPLVAMNDANRDRLKIALQSLGLIRH
jgi:4-hydroxy-tetrahydrodipicolinate synthase